MTRDFMEMWDMPPRPRLSNLHACSQCGERIDIANDPYLVTRDGGHLCAPCSATVTVARDTWWRHVRLWWRDRRDGQADWLDVARCTRQWERDGGYGRPFVAGRRSWPTLSRLEDASGYGVLLIAAASVLAIDALFWFSFGWQYWFVAVILCGLVACYHRRSPWPLLGALAAFVALGLAAHLALALFAVAARVWTGLMGVPA